MLRIQFTPASKRAKLRLYSPTSMTSAYRAVIGDKIPVFRAARQFGVPLTTLRDRVDRRISIDVTRSGPDTVFTQEQEAKFVGHIKDLASVGYGYTRAEVVNMATDYARHLGKRGEGEGLSMKWFYNFMGRWPELRVIKPSGLSQIRAKCASEEAIANYFTELNRIMVKYDLVNKPESIYNVDEKGINTEFRPPSVVAGCGFQPQAITSERSKTVTVIGAGNALGSQIPPYFVFPGVRLLPELLSGKSVGTSATMTPSGWSNSDVFREYLKDHFVKYIQGRGANDPVLVLYDGHRSHISLDLIEWAKGQNIVLFVLPPHCSHLLQPMDVGCFGPFQVIYNKECLSFTRQFHKTVTRYDVCGLACKAYTAALSPANLQSAFAKTGVYPLKTGEQILEMLEPKIRPSVLYTSAENMPAKEVDATDFFETKGGQVNQKLNEVKRRNISNIVGGRAITEDGVLEKMKEFINTSSSKKKRVNAPEVPATKTAKRQRKAANNDKRKNRSEKTDRNSSPQPGPSCINLIPSDDSDTDGESESQISAEEKCCVCGRFYAQSRDLTRVSITKWAQCDSCHHWVHLTYCSPVRVVRKNTPFRCPCCPPDSQ